MREDKKAFDNKKLKKQKPKGAKGFPMPLSPFQFGIGGNGGMYFNTEACRELFYSDTDPNGSYTGITRDGDDRPVQDADDL